MNSKQTTQRLNAMQAKEKARQAERRVLDTPRDTAEWLEIKGVLNPPFEHLSDLGRAHLGELYLNRNSLLHNADFRLAWATKRRDDVVAEAEAAVSLASRALENAHAYVQARRWLSIWMAFTAFWAGFLMSLAVL